MTKLLWELCGYLLVTNTDNIRINSGQSDIDSLPTEKQACVSVMESLGFGIFYVYVEHE